MFIYDKDKNVSVFTRGKNGTTNLHNNYWMGKEQMRVENYTDFDHSQWLFANPLPAVEDMTLGCVDSNLNHHHEGEDFFTEGNRRLGMYVWEYITFLKTCKLLEHDVEHYIVVRDPLQRLASGLSTSLQNSPSEVTQAVCGATFDEINEICRTRHLIRDDSYTNTLVNSTLRLSSSTYHAQSWLYHLDKHINMQDYNIQAIGIYDLVAFAKDKLDTVVLETDKDDEEWHGKHTGTRPPETRYYHDYIAGWLEETYEQGRLKGAVKNLLDREYEVYNKLTMKHYDINS